MFLCSNCPSSFSQRTSFAAHKRACELKILDKCEECEYSGNRRSLRNHKKRVHEGREIPCPRCENKFTDKSNLNNHVKSVHEFVKFSCDLCLPTLFPRSKNGKKNAHIQFHITRNHNEAGGEK